MNSVVTSLEADAIVRDRVLVRETHEAEVRTTIELIPSMSEARLEEGGRQIVLRKVAPPAELPTWEATETAQILPDEGLEQHVELKDREVINIQLHAYVYDGDYSEITLRLNNLEYTAWTNINLSYLSPIGAFETNTRDYSYFGMTTTISSEVERQRSEFAESAGYNNYESRWKVSPVSLASNEPEYVLVTEGTRVVPEEVYVQLDDLIAYYAANEDTLRIRYENALELQAARERYESANPPPPPKDVILNYSRVSGEAAE